MGCVHQPQRAEPLIFETLIFSSVILSTLLLRSTVPIRPIAWCAIGLCAGLYLFFNGFRLLQRRRLILDTPVSKIRSASMGTVELSGLAVGPYSMLAPVTERSCYYFRSVVWEWKRQGRGRKWVKVAAECMHVPFFLDDNTGKVLVDPRGAELDLHCDFHQEFCDSLFTTKQEIPPNVRTFLSRHGIETTNKIKVEEFCIKPKNALFLLGTLGDYSGPELTPQPIQDEEVSLIAASLGGTKLGQSALSLVAEGRNAFSGLSLSGGLQHDPKYDSIYDKAISTASARIIHLSPGPGPTNASDMTQQQKIAAALLKAGISNRASWAAAGITPSALSTNTIAREQDANGFSHSSSSNGSAHVPSQPTASTDGFDLHPPVVLMKGRNNPTFLISWRSQRAIARSLAWKCTLMIWGGPALALICLYGLLILTHLV